MADFSLKHQPTSEIVTIDTDSPISDEELASKFCNRNSLLLLLRSEKGVDKRGGHFFNLEKVDNKYQLKTMEGDVINIFELSFIVRLINHSCGLKFDAEILNYCQNVLNFRTDDETKI